MYNINQPKPFATLQEFYMPAIHHPIMVGKKKMYNLSVPLGGQEIQVKRSAKKIKHASFAQVILGAVQRMRKLFESEKLDLAVIINKKPDPNDLTLEFELVNQNKFRIGMDDYFLTIIAQYSYSKSDVVTYYPIIYRQWCSNGAVAILNEQFKEIIPVDKILEIGCEWTKCNFKTYINRVNNYFERLKGNRGDIEMLIFQAERLMRNLLGVKNTNTIVSLNSEDNYPRDRRSLNSILNRYIEELGNNELAVFNAITEYASQEPNLNLRYQYLMSIGKYLSKEMNKIAKLDRYYWSEKLDWNGLIKLVD
jgi:hypothetical protein